MSAYTSSLIILLEKFLSASAVAIISRQDVTRSSLCSGVKECEKKNRAHNFLFLKSSFRIRRTIVWGTFKDSAIILVEIRRTFFDQISNSSNVYLISSRFWTATYLVSTTSFLGVKSGRGVTLTPRPLLVPLVMKE